MTDWQNMEQLNEEWKPTIWTVLANLTLNQRFSLLFHRYFSLQWHVVLTSHSRRLPCGPVPVPQAPSPPLTQSNPNLSGQQHHGPSEVGTLQCQSPAHRCLHSQGPALNEDNISLTAPGKLTGSAACSGIQACMEHPHPHTPTHTLSHAHKGTFINKIMKAEQPRTHAH